jgi:TorA maturation chaperone TorD
MVIAKSPSVVSALARAAVYRTFSQAFQAPTEVGLRAMGAFDDFATLRHATQCLDAHSSSDVAACVDGLRSASRPLGALTAQYWRVFGHTVRGMVCPCETEYGDDNKYEQPQQLADIAGYYLAFGLTPLPASELRHDHVACECEFLSFLHLKQALFLEECAKTAGGAETLEVTCRAERSFLRDHLGRFGRAFASCLAGDTCGPYYSAWGTLFLRWLDRECARHGVAVGPTDLAVRTEFSDEAPMACGSASDLIQIQRP